MVDGLGENAVDSGLARVYRSAKRSIIMTGPPNHEITSKQWVVVKGEVSCSNRLSCWPFLMPVKSEILCKKFRGYGNFGFVFKNRKESSIIFGNDEYVSDFPSDGGFLMRKKNKIFF